MKLASLRKPVMVTIFALTAAACTLSTRSADAANNGPAGDSESDSGVNSCAFAMPSQFSLLKTLPQANVCEGRDTSIVALTNSQLIFLCKNGEEVGSFDFALGRAGIDKRLEGDLKTPIGTYRLGEPRSSERFGIFIPVGYPTKKQAAMGYTGKEIGIHGPDRRFRCAGILNLTFNWTQGCLAVASDPLIERIAKFVDQNPGLLLHILTPAEELELYTKK